MSKRRLASAGREHRRFAGELDVELEVITDGHCRYQARLPLAWPVGAGLQGRLGYRRSFPELARPGVLANPDIGRKSSLPICKPAHPP